MDQKEAAYYVLCQPSYNNCAAVVSYMAGYFKDKGLYFEDTQDLCRGDIVFFQNESGLSHVGICVDWDDYGFTTVEGNKNNCVANCKYPFVVGGYVAGFAHPRYTDSITEQAVIAYALSQVGYEEGANNWNKYAEQLDAVDYFAGCGKKQNLPWCAVFVCACFYNAYSEAISDDQDDSSDKDDLNELISSLYKIRQSVSDTQQIIDTASEELKATKATIDNILNRLEEEG